MKPIAIGAGGLMFNSEAGQEANGSPPQLRFFGAVLLRRQAVEMGPATRYSLQRNNASIIKI